MSGSGRGLDPVLLDLVYPTDGDAEYAAKLQFYVGVEQSRSKRMADCVADKGYPGSDSLIMAQVQSFATTMGALPALSHIAEDGLTPIPTDTPREVTEAILACRDMVKSKAIVWFEKIMKLHFEGVKKTRAAIGAVEATPVWEEARACMVEAGAPTETDPHSGPSLGYYLWASTADSNFKFNAGREATGPSPEAQAYVRCMRPFFDEVGRRLEEPRRAFLEKHREELLELQAEYATVTR
jgi:hypothetical protein